MDSDPWSWSIQDVVHFFQKDADNFISDMPHGQLPPLDHFTQTLKDNDVTGAALLTAVDPSFLRDDCGIKSLGLRTSVIHCIRKLQRTSRIYGTQPDPLRWHTPVSAPQPLQPAAPAEGGAAVPSTETVGEHIRPGEIGIEDGHGRKRRKLNLTKNEPIITNPLASVATATGSYLSNLRIPVDEVFYGKTQLGQAIGEMQPAGKVLLEGDQETEDEDCQPVHRGSFQFVGQGLSCGEAEYVHARIRSLLLTTDIRDVRRNDREALAIMPYREDMQAKGKPRSATVFQFDHHDRATAVRENAALLDSGYDYNGLSQASATEEWDFLLQRYKSKGSHIISIGGNSESGDEASRIVTETEDGAEQASEDSVDILGREPISEIFDEVVETVTKEWDSHKRPTLELKRAWTVWKQMKKSKALRSALIDGGHARIRQLDDRLSKFKEDFCAEEFGTLSSLLQALEILEPTVHDREEERWKIAVWQRRQEPEHAVRRRPNTERPIRSALQTPATDKPQVYLGTLGPNDRMSTSPGPDQSPVAVPIVEDNEQDQYFTPNITPVMQPGTPNEVPDVPDMTSLGCPDEFAGSPGMDADDEEDEHPGTDLDIVDGYGEDDRQDSDFDMAKAEEGHSQETDLDLPKRKNSLARELSWLEKNNDPQVQRAPTPPDGVAYGDVDTTSEGLPSPRTFPASQHRKTKNEPGTPNKLAPKSIEAIDLTLSSSDPPTSTKRRVKGERTKPIAFSANPDEATAEDVDAWDVDELARSRDRRRLLIKLLRDAGSETRDRMFRCTLNFKRPVYVDQLQRALHALRSQEPEREGVQHDNAEAMLHTAQIAAAWMLADPHVFKVSLIAQAQWDAVCQDRVQMALFFDVMRSLLVRKESKLFNSPKRTSSAATVVISDDGDGIDEEGPLHSSPHKQRKRRVKASQAGQQSRRSALQRQEQYDARIAETQSSNAAQLEDMIASTPSNSGIEINPARDQDEAPIYIHANIAKKMKAHQIDGARFLWREITAGGEDGGQGCLLAHTMGLGKTIQSIALLIAVTDAAASKDNSVRTQLPKHLRHKDIRKDRRVRMLILSPPSLLQNWRREIEQWAPRALGNIFTVEAGQKPFTYMRILNDWYRVGGVLLLGYSIFRKLIRRKKDGVPEHAERIDAVLLEGTEIVVADEAHNIKNAKSSIALAVQKIKTESRIALTGTPMSNDVQEIYELISWVAPGYLGEPAEFRARYAEPIQEGTYVESTPYEVRRSKKKLEVLRTEIEPKVNRADITALKGSLEPKVEFLITVDLTHEQIATYKKYVAAVVGGGQNEHASQVRIFSWLAVLTLLTNHPRCFRRKLLTPPKPRKARPKATPGARTPSLSESGGETPLQLEELDIAAPQLIDDTNAEVPGDEDVYALGFTEAKIQEVVKDLDDAIDFTRSSKTSIFLYILAHSRKCEDKLLVFSSSIPTLQYLDDLFRELNVPFGRIDGAVSMDRRTQLLEDFHKAEWSVMLVSTRAGGVGLNIQDANRVVIFDFSFNPTYEEQAIGRAYRLGQRKPVFVYRFVTGGTFETNIYNKQLFKTSLASRVVDKKNPHRHAERNTRDWLYEPKPVEQEDLTQWLGKDPEVLDGLIAKHGVDGQDCRIRSIKTMETLQVEAPDDPLNEEERQEVAREIEEGRNRVRTRRAAVDAPGNPVMGLHQLASRPPPLPTQFRPTIQTPKAHPAPQFSNHPVQQNQIASSPALPGSTSGRANLASQDLRNAHARHLHQG